MEDPNAMNRRHALIAYILIACTLVLALIARASDTRTGSWTISHSDEPGKVSFALIYHSKHNNSNHESDWPSSEFKGVDFAKSGKQDVKFTIARDAGRFDCEGYLKDGEGAGVFHFAPDAKYLSQMSALGFTGIDEDKQFSMAVLDVSVAYAKRVYPPLTPTSLLPSAFTASLRKWSAFCKRPATVPMKTHSSPCASTAS